MRARALLISTAIIVSLLSAVAVYLVLTVPNDIQANVLLRRARSDLAEGRTDRARDSLSKIVQQYPRTDAAAAATVALVKIGDDERRRLQRDLDSLRRDLDSLRHDRDQQASAITHLQKTVEELKNTPPKTVIVEKPAPPAPKKTIVPHARPNRRHPHPR